MRGIRNTAILLSVGSRRAGFSARLAPDDVPRLPSCRARGADPDHLDMQAVRCEAVPLRELGERSPNVAGGQVLGPSAALADEVVVIVVIGQLDDPGAQA